MGKNISNGFFISRTGKRNHSGSVWHNYVVRAIDQNVGSFSNILASPNTHKKIQKLLAQRAVLEKLLHFTSRYGFPELKDCPRYHFYIKGG